MNRAEVFQILEIEDTKDKCTIKNAYRVKLTVTNPEDDPEGFIRLRTAYEEACRMAEHPDAPKDTVKQEELGDSTPSGQWLEKAKAIYADIGQRRDVECWKELFHDDCFQSLEEEENCRLKLLGFLMTHFRLPTDVWKLFDKHLNIVKDAAGLKEHFPADFVRYIIGKCERGEDVDFSQFEGEIDATYDLFLQHYDLCWHALQEGNLEYAQENLEKADQLGIQHPVLEICRAKLLLEQNKSHEAIALMEKLRARYPGDAMVEYNAAEDLWQLNEHDRAAEIFLSLKQETDSHYMANFRLTEWYYEKGRYREAKQCAEKVLYSGADPAFMDLLARVNAEIEKDLEKDYRENGGWEPALELCWCYLQDGRAAKGIRLAAKLEKHLPPEKEAEYNGLLAKLFVEEAEYEDSIAMTKSWETALEKRLAAGGDAEEMEKDQDRLRQAHMIRMQCYHSLGFKKRENFSRAINEGESVLTDTLKDVGVLLEMAQIYVEMQEYERCMELVDKLVNEYQVYAAHAIALEAYRRQLDAGGVISAGRECIHYFQGFVNAYEYMAKVYLDLGYPEDFWKVLEDAEKNKIKSVILEAYRYQMNNKKSELSLDVLNERLKNFRRDYLSNVEKGRLAFYESGLKVLTEYLYQFPDSFMLVERALFHRAAHHYEEAKEDYEKALALKPANPYALNNLSFVYKYTGDYEKALVYIKKAVLYMDDQMSPVIYTDMADIYSLLGDYERALLACRRYESMVREPDIWYLNQLGECYIDLGQTEEACRVFERYSERERYGSLRRQVDACVKGGRGEKARELLSKWESALDAKYGRGIRRLMNLHIATIKPMSSNLCDYHSAVGWAELVVGEKTAALSEFGKALKYLKYSGKSDSGKLGDAVFACVVCGNEKLGVKWGKQLKECLAKESWDSEDKYYDRRKMQLQLKLLSVYFSESGEKLEEMLESERECQICSFCTSPLCKELEGVRVMFLIRTGREQEARERLQRNLEIQPADEYMLAIRHMVFSDFG